MKNQDAITGAPGGDPSDPVREQGVAPREQPGAPAAPGEETLLPDGVAAPSDSHEPERPARTTPA